MIEKKLISFTVLKNECAWCSWVTKNVCTYSKKNPSRICNKENCPIWKKLDDTMKMVLTKEPGLTRLISTKGYK